MTSVQTDDPEISVPPGVDSSGVGSAQALKPAWRQIAIFAGLGLAVALLLLVALPRPHGGAVKRIDPSDTVARARQLGTLAVFMPSALPPGWIPDSVNLDAGKGHEHLHLGYQAPDFGIVGLEETTARKWRSELSQITAGGVPTDYVTLNGQRWVHLESPRRNLPALVWYGPGREVVIVTGTTTMANLQVLAASLNISDSGASRPL